MWLSELIMTLRPYAGVQSVTDSPAFLAPVVVALEYLKAEPGISVCVCNQCVIRTECGEDYLQPCTIIRMERCAAPTNFYDHGVHLRGLLHVRHLRVCLAKCSAAAGHERNERVLDRDTQKSDGNQNSENPLATRGLTQATSVSDRVHSAAGADTQTNTLAQSLLVARRATSTANIPWHVRQIAEHV